MSQLDTVNAGRAARGAEPLDKLPSIREPMTEHDLALVDRIADVFKRPGGPAPKPEPKQRPKAKPTPAPTPVERVASSDFGEPEDYA